MKFLKLLFFFLISTQIVCQEKFNTKYENNGLFISGGVHLGFWAISGQEKIPYNFQIDKSFGDDYCVGIGYTHDEYIKNPTSWRGGFENCSRDNLNIRFYSFFNQKKENFRSFIGGAVGISYWNSEYQNSKNNYYPTAQLIYGFRIKISNMIFNQTEFALGPPSAFKTSIGINF
jgi:hypothetical protein